MTFPATIEPLKRLRYVSQNREEECKYSKWQTLHSPMPHSLPKVQLYITSQPCSVHVGAIAALVGFHHLYKFSIASIAYRRIDAYRNRCPVRSVTATEWGEILHFSMEHENSTKRTLGMHAYNLLPAGDNEDSWSKKKGFENCIQQTNTLLTIQIFANLVSQKLTIPMPPCEPQTKNSHPPWIFDPFAVQSCHWVRSSAQNVVAQGLQKETAGNLWFFSSQTALVKMIALNMDCSVKTPMVKDTE